jgi:hypothetical protein
MSKKKLIFFLIFLISLYFLYEIFKKYQVKDQLNNLSEEEKIYSSNIIKDVNYTSKDANGNQYIINAAEGEIDLSDSSIIYLTDVTALIKLNNKNNVTIRSKYGKYNINNYDTIFSKNVIVDYLDNKINSEYLDFSINRNSMIISKNVVYTNLKNILKADVIEMNIKTKDTKIFMYDSKKRVNIKTKE